MLYTLVGALAAALGPWRELRPLAAPGGPAPALAGGAGTRVIDIWFFSCPKRLSFAFSCCLASRSGKQGCELLSAVAWLRGVVIYTWFFSCPNISESLSTVAWLRDLVPASLTVCSTAPAGPPWLRILATAPRSSAVPGRLLFSLTLGSCELASSS